jgi:hypothetical protein
MDASARSTIACGDPVHRDAADICVVLMWRESIPQQLCRGRTAILRLNRGDRPAAANVGLTSHGRL